MLGEFKRFDLFAGADREILLDVARCASLVDVPSGRWLVRRGRRVTGSLFLVRGTVRTLAPDRVVAAHQARARQPLYPGVGGLLTLSSCRLLQVRDRGLELLGARPDLGFAEVTDADNSWQSRFLRSALMDPLPAAIWQQVLSRLQGVVVAQGDLVIREQDQADSSRCFVLARGSARVSRGRRILNTLGPGDLFGEDALISGCPRNASVRMFDQGLIMEFEAHDFDRLLQVVLTEHGNSDIETLPDSSLQTVCFDAPQGMREKIDLLDDRVSYLVISPSEEISRLALFLMRKRGLTARS